MVPKNNNFKCWGGDWKALLYRKKYNKCRRNDKIGKSSFCWYHSNDSFKQYACINGSKTIRGEITGEQGISIVSKYHLTEYLLVNKGKSTWKWKFPQITP